MITPQHWANLKSTHASLDEAWEHLKVVSDAEDPKEIQRATMLYFQALQQVYSAVQDAVSLL